MLIFASFARNNGDHYPLILLENCDKFFNENLDITVVQFETYTEQLR